MKEYYIGKSLKGLISDQDAWILSSYHWRPFYKDHTTYAIANIWKKKVCGASFRSTISMHRLITQPRADLVVDHINRNGLDNRRENLRTVSIARNNENRNPWGAVEFRGVSAYTEPYGKVWYRARITNPETKKRVYLGKFDSAEEAARAYDEAALRFHGDFFGLNFPKEPVFEFVPDEPPF